MIRRIRIRPRDTLVRYTANERTNHWIVAIAFVLAALSGLALFHPALFWLSAAVRRRHVDTHPASDHRPLMALVFVLLAVSVWKDNRMQERDWRWLRQMKDVINNREERCPKSGATTPDRSCCSS